MYEAVERPVSEKASSRKVSEQGKPDVAFSSPQPLLEEGPISYSGSAGDIGHRYNASTKERCLRRSRG
jgi:hypothetical protein